MSDNFDPVNNGVAGLDTPPDERLAVVGDRYEFWTKLSSWSKVGLIGTSAEVMDVTEDHIVVKFTRFVGSVRGNPEWRTISTADFRQMADKAIRDGATFIPAK